MDSARELIARAITADLFGDGGLDLTSPAELSVPPRYRLEDCLGRGGFGVVYRAQDTELGRAVAIKFLTNAAPADVERFRREARFAARLTHPAVVKVFELGRHEDQHYMSMELVDGPNLARAQLEREAMLRAVRRVAEALQQAHAAGIVHRDIKPENILIDGRGEARLTDFGIARDLGGAGTLSGSGMIMGSPMFMSPEQARGEPRSVDGRSDVYSLGATLYSLLCGRPPFAGEGGVVRTLHAVITQPPALPRSLDPSISRGLEALVLRCLRKAKADRYGTMGELIAALDACDAGDAPAGANRHWFRRLVGAPEPPPAPTPPSEVSAALELARDLAAWDAELYRVSTDVTRLYPRLQSMIERLDGILAERPDQAWARFTRGMAQLRLGRVDEAFEDMERAIDRVADLAHAHFELGRVYLRLGLAEQERAHRHLSHTGHQLHIDATRDRLAQAVVAFQEARRLGRDLPAWQIACAGAVERLAVRDFAGCVEACDGILDADPDLEEVWKLRGDALRLDGQDPVESYQRAAEVRRSFHGALFALAEAHLAAGRLDAAHDALQRTLRVHPGYVPALVLSAKLHLRAAEEDTRASDDPAAATAVHPALDQALELLGQARRRAPESYELALTQAEVELRRAAARPESVDAALKTLTRAQHLHGCQNRVEHMLAKAYLTRARTTRAAGGDPTADLDAAERLATGEQLEVPDNHPWMAVLREVAELRETGGGPGR